MEPRWFRSCLQCSNHAVAHHRLSLMKLNVFVFHSFYFLHQGLDCLLDFPFYLSQFFWVLMLFRIKLVCLLLNLSLKLLQLIHQILLYFDSLKSPFLVIFAPLIQLVQMRVKNLFLALQNLFFQFENSLLKLFLDLLLFLFVHTVRITLVEQVIDLVELAQIIDWWGLESWN